jgi:dipeptidyl aminopeptidase/acylaminoacyl peptidase
LHVVDLATCREGVRPGHVAQPSGLTSPDGRIRAIVRTTADWWTIVVTKDGHSRELYRVSRHYHVVSDDKGPIELLRWSGDGRWLFFVIDPDGSGSIEADGLMLRVISADGGRPVRIARMLVYRDYLAWCGGRLVFTAGGDRVATDRKRLLVASPPRWHPRPLVPGTRRVWGSLVCSPNGGSLVAQSQGQSSNPSFFATHWALWRVGLDGSTERLTSPPRGFADESPRFSKDGRVLLFVHTRQGNGSLYSRRGGRVAGPILSLGNNSGYYGHHDWWQTAAWSLSR